MGNGITPLSQILYDLFFDMSLVHCTYAALWIILVLEWRYSLITFIPFLMVRRFRSGAEI
jgi:hypothetical protein